MRLPGSAVARHGISPNAAAAGAVRVPAPGRADWPVLARIRDWWQRQSPARQDRVAFMGPLVSVLLFLAAITAAFWYLRAEEMDREQETIRRDLGYAQQQLRLRLIDGQEQLMSLARDVANRSADANEFQLRGEALLTQYPELQSVSWVNARRRVMSSETAASLPASLRMNVGEILRSGESDSTFTLARDLRQPVYTQPQAAGEHPTALQLHIPILDGTRFAGMVIAEYSLDAVLRYGLPPDVAARYAVALLDGKGETLVGAIVAQPPATEKLLPWMNRPEAHEAPVTPVGNGLILRVQTWRTSLGLVGSGLFWLVTVLAVMTAWMLLATWGHTRRRMQAQKALVAETNFRRAMENSMPTGMRALDLHGRITYVNAAFCHMTGWSERELIGCTAPFPYWPDGDRVQLMARLRDELSGRVSPAGIQVRVKRKDGSLFDARIYVSPLIDALGKQTGWMTSMTDITEPNRIREQLSASYERFTTVLEALDAAVSVTPLGGDELLFANKMYRQWFGAQAAGHAKLAAEAGVPTPPPTGDEARDSVDSLAGLPASSLTGSDVENAEIFVPELGKWLEVRTRYLSWVDSRLAQMVIASDITPRRRAEEQAEHQAERAQTASRLITMGEMASSVAHELNQPLTAINNYCNGLLSRIRGQQLAEADLLKALEKTAHQAQRAGQIIQRIRSFVKRSEPNRQPSDAAAIVEEAIELAGIELRRRNVRLSHYIASRMPAIDVDPILIEQVLVNLLRNAAEAIDAADRPPPRRHVELRVVPVDRDGQRMVEFSVSDTGHGMPPEVQQRLYESFFSTKAEGMGIGLSLCRSIVESHQGRMEARNLYNGDETVGCRFSFWLPLASRGAGTADPPPTQPGVLA